MKKQTLFLTLLVSISVFATSLVYGMDKALVPCQGQSAPFSSGELPEHDEEIEDGEQFRVTPRYNPQEGITFPGKMSVIRGTTSRDEVQEIFRDVFGIHQVPRKEPSTFQKVLYFGTKYACYGLSVGLAGWGIYTYVHTQQGDKNSFLRLMGYGLCSASCYGLADILPPCVVTLLGSR